MLEGHLEQDSDLTGKPEQDDMPSKSLVPSPDRNPILASAFVFLWLCSILARWSVTQSLPILSNAKSDANKWATALWTCGNKEKNYI